MPPRSDEQKAPQPLDLEIKVEQPIELSSSVLPLQEKKAPQMKAVPSDFNSPQQTPSPEGADLQTSSSGKS